MMTRVMLFFCLGLALARAEMMEIPWSAIDQDLKVWKPEGFDPAKKWPAIVYYHGTNGKPTVDLLKKHTGGKDFVLVGMTYKTKGRFQYEARSIADEMGLLNALKKLLVVNFSVDPQRIHVAGFSKGGWYSALLLERDRTLAGGMILGGGVFQAPGQLAAQPYERKIPIYIGSGRADGNYPQSLRALLYFRKLGADVSLETWPDVGHSYPKKTPVAMEQWLRIQARPAGLADEAKEWMVGRLGEIDGMPEPLERWYALEEFITLPFVTKFGSAELKLAKERSGVLLKDQEVAAENRLREESRSILRAELKDRKVTTLENAAQRYAKLADKAKGSRVGDEAAMDTGRTMKLLAGAKQTERTVEKGEAIDVPLPVGPTDQRSGFPLMPGVTVKPVR